MGTAWLVFRSNSRSRAWQAVHPEPAPVSRQTSLTVAEPQTAIASFTMLSLTPRQWHTIDSVQSEAECVRVRICMLGIWRRKDSGGTQFKSRVFSTTVIENESQLHGSIIYCRGRGVKGKSILK